ncbi:hypothetical protein KESI111651_09475 [Kerstersia similis]
MNMAAISEAGASSTVNSASAMMQPIKVPIRRSELRWRVSAKPGFMMATMVSTIQ